MNVNQKLATVGRRIIVFALSAIFIFSFLLSGGCVKEKKIEDYPEPVTDVSENPGAQETSENKEDKNKRLEMSNEEFYELVALPNPYESGQFVFTDDAIPQSYTWDYRDRPEIIINAKAIVKAALNGESIGKIPPEAAVSLEDFQIALDLAKLSYPMMDDAIGGNSEDGTEFHIDYNPVFVLEPDLEEGDVVETIQEESTEFNSDTNDFVYYVIDLINKNVSPEDSDMEKAEAVYKALVSEFEPVMRPIDADSIIEEDGTEIIIPYSSSLGSDMMEKKLDYLEIARLYQFILTQLGIECLTVTSYGNYTKQNLEELDKFIGDEWYNVWNVVIVDGKAYNCDLFFEMALLSYQRGFEPQTDPGVEYFGMSDEVMGKSFEANRDKLAEYSFKDPLGYFESLVNGGPVPFCEEDYYLR